MAQRLKVGGSNATGKKNFAERQMPAIPKDYIPRGSPARAKTRRGLDRDAAVLPERSSDKRAGNISLL